MPKPLRFLRTFRYTCVCGKKVKAMVAVSAQQTIQIHEGFDPTAEVRQDIECPRCGLKLRESDAKIAEAREAARA